MLKHILSFLTPKKQAPKLIKQGVTKTGLLYSIIDGEVRISQEQFFKHYPDENTVLLPEGSTEQDRIAATIEEIEISEEKPEVQITLPEEVPETAQPVSIVAGQGVSRGDVQQWLPVKFNYNDGSTTEIKYDLRKRRLPDYNRTWQKKNPYEARGVILDKAD